MTRRTAEESGLSRRNGRTTVKMVAAEAGVSTATVSYVLSGRAGSGGPGVSSETERRVRVAAARLHYQPNRAARAMRTGRTGVALLCLHMMSDPWSLAVMEASAKAVRREDLIPLALADGDWFGALERQDCDVAYLDAVSDDAQTRDRLRALAQRGQRLVVFSETLEPDGFDVIRSRAVPACGLAVQHLLAEHQDVACLTSRAAKFAPGPSRYSVYVDQIREHGLPIRPDRIATFEPDRASAFEAAQSFLDHPDPPTAIYATTDFAGLAAIGAAHRLGLRVPQDVAVIGVGNTTEGAVSAPPLSTVGPQNFFERQAEVIATVARDGIHGEGTLHEFTWSLLPRTSTTGEPAPTA